MVSWVEIQKEQLAGSLRRLRGKKSLIVTQPFFPINETIGDVQILFSDDNSFKNDEKFRCDLYFNQGYSPDHDRLVYVRETERSTLNVTWFWDNHHLIADTMQSACLSDVYFYAHNYKSAYIRNKFSIDGGFIPLCPIFWEPKDVELAATKALLDPRSNLLYGGYNSYSEFPERDFQIREIKAFIADNNIFITPHGTPADAHPFYGMTPVDRLLEWMKYKVSLCISFGNNTAIRIFDTLLGGGIPLIVGRPADLDLIIPRHMQDMLPVVVVDDCSPQAVMSAYEMCLDRFDSGGFNGIMTRHVYTKDNHMPINRMTSMIDRIRNIAEQS